MSLVLGFLFAALVTTAGAEAQFLPLFGRLTARDFLVDVESVIDQTGVFGQRVRALEGTVELSNRLLVLDLELRVQDIHYLLEGSVSDDAP